MKKTIPFLVLASLASPSLAAPLGNPIVSIQSSATEGSHVLKASAGLLNGFSATAGATAGYVLLIDSATVPADGAITPKFCYALPASSTTAASWIEYPAPFNNGIVIVFSTTGCFTKTVSNTSFFSAQVQ
jgi:hypothetical protein